MIYINVKNSEDSLKCKYQLEQITKTREKKWDSLEIDKFHLQKNF